DRLRRVQGALPLATLAGGDLPAVVGDEGHSDVPVLAGFVEGGEVLVAPVLLHQLLPDREELGVGLRRRSDADAPVEILAVDDGARTRVVRDAVEVAAVRARLLEACEPGMRVRTVLRLQRGECS